jgi:hypothetical protein|uniref:DUF6915 domain-containing protein n=1 Tax=Desulfobacca acetoxidans TaxID=60893 RepID=A0A7V6DP68_9BACT
MPSLKKHCEESERVFGEAFKESHRWLDEFAGAPGFGMRHRKKRHHEAGIQQAIKLFGEIGGRVARQHIISDLKEEGWTEKDRFPQNEEDYVKMVLF